MLDTIICVLACSKELDRSHSNSLLVLKSGVCTLPLPILSLALAWSYSLVLLVAGMGSVQEVSLSSYLSQTTHTIRLLNVSVGQAYDLTSTSPYHSLFQVSSSEVCLVTRMRT